MILQSYRKAPRVNQINAPLAPSVTRCSWAQTPLTCSMGCSPGLVSTALCDPGKGTQQCGNICKFAMKNSASGRSLRLTQSLNCAHNISLSMASPSEAKALACLAELEVLSRH